MSVAVRRGLWAKMAADSTLTGLLGGTAIYHAQAPENVSYPFVVFNKQSGVPIYAFSSTAAFENEIWTIKAVDCNTTSDRVDAIATELDALLTDGTITVTGATLAYLRRDSDVELTETSNGETYQHAGAQFRLIYTR